MRNRIPLICLLPLVAVLAAAALGCGSSQVAHPPSVVLITIDTLRADHLQTYGYFRETSPNIDAFAEDALIFEHAIAPMATTLPTHVSIMTSANPARHGVLSNLRFFKTPLQTSDELQTAAQMLKRAGYRTAAFTSASPLSAETGIDAGFETFWAVPAYEFHGRRSEVTAEVTADAAIEWLQQVKPPFFLWIHLFDPHSPYSPPAPFDTAFADEPELSQYLHERSFPEQATARATESINRYDGEILYVDTQIGRLLEALEARGLREEAAVVLTADHGEGLHQHGVREHGVIWNEQVRVPLIFRFPAGPTGRVRAPASLIDIFPTLAGHAGVPVDRAQMDGLDLMHETREDVVSQRTLREGWLEPNLTLTGLDWKYWYFADKPDRLYHLAEDPHETRDVILQHAELATRMQGRLLNRFKTDRDRSSLDVSDRISESQREKLRSLGYVN